MMSAGAISEKFKLTRLQASDLMRALLREDLVYFCRNDDGILQYISKQYGQKDRILDSVGIFNDDIVIGISEAGRKQVKKSFGRNTAALHLAGGLETMADMIDEARTIGCDPEDESISWKQRRRVKLATVRVVVFGSFVNDTRQLLGDVDLAISIGSMSKKDLARRAKFDADTNPMAGIWHSMHDSRPSEYISLESDLREAGYSALKVNAYHDIIWMFDTEAGRKNPRTGTKNKQPMEPHAVLLTPEEAERLPDGGSSILRAAAAKLRQAVADSPDEKRAAARSKKKEDELTRLVAATRDAGDVAKAKVKLTAGQERLFAATAAGAPWSAFELAARSATGTWKANELRVLTDLGLVAIDETGLMLTKAGVLRAKDRKIITGPSPEKAFKVGGKYRGKAERGLEVQTGEAIATAIFNGSKGRVLPWFKMALIKEPYRLPKDDGFTLAAFARAMVWLFCGVEPGRSFSRPAISRMVEKLPPQDFGLRDAKDMVEFEYRFIEHIRPELYDMEWYEMVPSVQQIDAWLKEKGLPPIRREPPQNEDTFRFAPGALPQGLLAEWSLSDQPRRLLAVISHPEATPGQLETAAKKLINLPDVDRDVLGPAAARISAYAGPVPKDVVTRMAADERTSRWFAKKSA
jgi:predicted nucleotidyltransferase